MGEKGGSGLSFRSKTAIGLACALVAVVLALLALATCSHQPESSGGPVASPVKVVLSGDLLPDAAVSGKVVLYGGETPVDEREFENVGEIDFGKVGPNEVKAVVESVPVASDGSTYTMPAESETLTITGSGEEVVLEIKLERMAAEDMTKEQLEAVAGEPEPSKPAHTHDWVAQTEQKWVVDQAAWDEPVYETVERAICNGCGKDITANPTQHMKDAGRGSACGSWHSEVKTVQTGTIHHDEVGHYETVTVGYACSGCGATK